MTVPSTEISSEPMQPRRFENRNNKERLRAFDRSGNPQ